MDWGTLYQEYNKLQKIHGDSSLDAIISGGKRENPDICLVFMNPTARNIASSPDWTSLKAPWIGTKTIWSFLTEANLLDHELLKEINNRQPHDWNYEFAEQVYDNVERNNVYITNLAKCTQKDSQSLPNSVFEAYLPLLHEELNLVKPQKIVVFGNQASSIFMKMNIGVSKNRKIQHDIIIKKNSYPTFPVYYPVGQGQRNIDKAVEDVRWIIKS